jgi:hypothetical protein
MDFLRRLFGGGGGSRGDAAGMYFYVRPKGCDEVVQIRIDRNNDLSAQDEGDTYWVHKYVRGSKCFQQAEINLYFDKNRQFVNSEVTGGALVTQADYEAWLATQA